METLQEKQIWLDTVSREKNKSKHFPSNHLEIRIHALEDRAEKTLKKKKKLSSRKKNPI